MLDVEVKRSEWGRGDKLWENSLTQLHAFVGDTDNSVMCCLGFMCRELGISGEDMSDICYPTGLSSRFEVIRNLDISDDSYQLVGMINDDKKLPDTNREDMIRQWGKANGIEFTFVD